jgi:hypothetical protein
VVSVSPAELADRTRANHGVSIDPRLAAMFLAWWLEVGVVEEPLPGRYRITEAGRDAAAGLFALDGKSERAA